MTTAIEITQTFFDLINTGRSAEVFGLLTPSSKYTVIGKTAISRTYHGKKDVDDNMLPVLASFKDGPHIICHAVIADGDWAVVLASGTGTGPTGDYDQP